MSEHANTTNTPITVSLDYLRAKLRTACIEWQDAVDTVGAIRFDRRISHCVVADTQRYSAHRRQRITDAATALDAALAALETPRQ